MPRVKEFNHSTIRVPIHFGQLAESIKQLTLEERETLEIMLDEPFYNELLKRIQDSKKSVKNRKWLTLDELKRGLDL